jgi:HK97 gp10 family phage protein
MITTRFGINGGPETARALRELGRNSSAEKVLRQALGAGASEVLASAREHVPVDTGALKKSLSIGYQRSPGQYQARVAVGHRGPRGRISHLLEFGTRKMAAQPYMRPALADSSEHALKAFASAIWPQIVREATRVASRAAGRKSG